MTITILALKGFVQMECNEEKTVRNLKSGAHRSQNRNDYACKCFMKVTTIIFIGKCLLRLEYIKNRTDKESRMEYSHKQNRNNGKSGQGKR